MNPDIRVFPDCLLLRLTDDVQDALSQTECVVSAPNADGYVRVAGSMSELFEFLVFLTFDGETKYTIY